MIAVIQRCKNASVIIDGNIHNEIGKGLLVLLGIKKGDNENNTHRLVRKILDLRIFDDEKGVMNLSIKDINGELLIISQFTLCADNGKSGNRPSYANAETPEISNPMYRDFIQCTKDNYEGNKVKDGVFGADMQISLVNDGPVTIILDK